MVRWGKHARAATAASSAESVDSAADVVAQSEETLELQHRKAVGSHECFSENAADAHPILELSKEAAESQSPGASFDVRHDHVGQLMPAARQARLDSITQIAAAASAKKELDAALPDEIHSFSEATPELRSLLKDLLLRPDAGTVGLVGLGKKGRSDVHALCHGLGFRHISRHVTDGKWKGERLLCISWCANVDHQRNASNEVLHDDDVEADKRNRWRKTKTPMSPGNGSTTSIYDKEAFAPPSRTVWATPLTKPAMPSATLAMATPLTKPAMPLAALAVVPKPFIPTGKGSCVVWLRDDMRLSDNPALRHAAENYDLVVPVYIKDTEDPSPYPLTGAGLVWKYESLRHFESTLCRLGSRLVFRIGRPQEELENILTNLPGTSEEKALFFNRRCEPWYEKQDVDVVARLGNKNGICDVIKTFPGNLLFEPWLARADERWKDLKAREKAEGHQWSTTGAGGYRTGRGKWKLRGFGSVAFWGYAIQELGEPQKPEPTIQQLPPCFDSITGVSLKSLGYHRTSGQGIRTDFVQYSQSECRKDSQAGDWAAELRRWWKVGEEAAQNRLEVFLQDVLAQGAFEGRERLRADQANTAVISPFIRFGELSVRSVYWAARGKREMTWQHFAGEPPTKGDKATAHFAHATFLRRFCWRDMAYWFLWKWPSMPDEPLRPQYAQQRWTGTSAQLSRWQKGRTGFPLVDAAMAQLWRVGWMPNYLRHVVAQFLIEYLDVHWREGRRWFDWTLVDADVAINAYMWQNGGHSGPDHWQFILHPEYAAKACDPDGTYVRKWLPELAHLPADFIHCPWDAPVKFLLAAANLNHVYTDRMVQDLNKARVAHARNVLQVRKDNPHLIARTGNEWLKLADGTLVGLITRADFRADTETFIFEQTPGHKGNRKCKPLDDAFNLVLGDYDRLFKQWEELQSTTVT